MSYKRVIPRDLFNEAKLLKCLGKLSMAINDGVPACPLLTVEYKSLDKGFVIDNDIDGNIFVTNLKFQVDGENIHVSSPLNCRSNWPLEYIDDEGTPIDVFTEDGSFSDEFEELVSGK